MMNHICPSCSYQFKFPSINVLNDQHDFEVCCPKCKAKLSGIKPSNSNLKYVIGRYELLKLIP